jgi:hypothetical protein
MHANARQIKIEDQIFLREIKDIKHPPDLLSIHAN